MKREMTAEVQYPIWRMFFPGDTRGVRGRGELKSFINKRRPPEISQSVWDNYPWMKRALIVEKAEKQKLLQKQKEQFLALMQRPLESETVSTSVEQSNRQDQQS